MQNIELKAKYSRFAYARKCVLKLGGDHHETIHQTDVYFRIPDGRMKLRYIRGASGYLVFYKRNDNPEPRASEYYIYDTKNPEALEKVLTKAHGMLAKVQKKREVHLIDNVRIHLDDVNGLGQFIEFEAVLSSEKSAVEEKQKLENYMKLFAIDHTKLQAISYLDMVLAQSKANEFAG